jgi:hypothetical protein
VTVQDLIKTHPQPTSLDRDAYAALSLSGSVSWDATSGLARLHGALNKRR